MDFSALSDNELVQRFVSHKYEQPQIRDELFGRYYERFDQRIRAVLHSRGLPYSANETYYNDVFMAIYDQVFSLAGLEGIALGYNTGKGEFGKWFLNYVVVNKVRDWLKKVDRETGLKNIDRLRWGAQRERDKLSLQQPTAVNGTGRQTLADIISAEPEFPDTERQALICQAIAHLPPSQKVIVHLLFIAYAGLPHDDLNYLVAELDIPKSVLSSQLKALQDKLSASVKFKAGERKELALACLKEQHDYLTQRVAKLKRELEGLYPDIGVRDFNDQFAGLKLKDIKTTKEDLAASYKAKLISSAEYKKKSLLIKYHEALIYLAKIAKRRQLAQQEYVSGKYLTLPSYQELAEALHVAVGTVASRINRAATKLKNQLGIVE